MPPATSSGAPPPHVLVIPFPCQGHIIPLMHLSHRLVRHGCRITFLNSEFDHARVTRTLAGTGDTVGEGIDLAAIPDGMADGESRNDLNRLVDSYSTTMPALLEDLIAGINRKGAAKGRSPVSWLVADENMAWSFPVAKKLGIRTACFWPASAACLAIMFSIPRLIQSGILDDRGLPVKEEMFRLAPGMPPIKTTEMSWNNAGDPSGQQIIFQLVVRNNKLSDLAETIICNTFHEAEAAALSLFPSIHPIGPLATGKEKLAVGHFWAGEDDCLSWLDLQEDRSVVYVAFGSFTVFGPGQFRELAEGLKLAGRPFLWVVRPDFTTANSGEDQWLQEYTARVAPRGKIVSWCPQTQVLEHAAVACFVSHCGWNSTMEGVWNGVPFLCWPYFCEQFLNQSYICNVWRAGLPMVDGGDVGACEGLVTKEKVREKVEELLGSEEIKERAAQWRDVARRCAGEGGSSDENFRNFLGLVGVSD